MTLKIYVVWSNGVKATFGARITLIMTFSHLPIVFAIDMTANDIENDESDDQNQNKYH